MKTIITLFSFFLSSFLFAQQFSPNTLWEKTYGGIKAEEGNSIIQTKDGGFAIAGFTNSTGVGGFDFLVIKTDVEGNKEWEKTFGDKRSDAANSIIQTKDGGFVVAGYKGLPANGYNDFWIIRLNGAGKLIWEKTFGVNNRTEYATSVVQAHDGGFVVVGAADSKKNRGYDALAIKLDKNGNKEWEKAYGGRGSDVANAIVSDKRGGFIIAGYTGARGRNDSDFWLLKIDNQGIKEWEKAFGNDANDFAKAIVQTEDGGFVLAGYTSTIADKYFDLWMIKTKENGDLVWQKTYGGDRTDYANSIVQTKDNGFALAGYTNSKPNQDSDFWVLKTNKNGLKEWEKTFGSAYDDNAKAIAETENGGLVVTGGIKSKGADDKDLWLIRFHPGDIDTYIKSYVEENLTDWLKKGRYEKTYDYQKRIKEHLQSGAPQQLADEALTFLKNQYLQGLDFADLQNKSYDADNETMLVGGGDFPDFVVPVPLNDAPELEANWLRVKFQNPDFDVKDNSMILSYLELVFDDHKYIFDARQPHEYVLNDIEFDIPDLPEIDFSNIKIESAPTETSKATIQIEQAKVDTDIPINLIENPNTFAVIIGNQNYETEVNVPFAHNDAKVFAAYCEKTLGIPEENIHLKLDATYGNLKGEIGWLKDIADAYGKDAKILFYYAGHGMPNEKTKDACLLPVDGSATNTETALLLSEIYTQLSNLDVQRVIVFLDACFSGGTREGTLAFGERKIGIRTNPLAPKGKLIIFSATSETQTAFPFREKRHGMFTYYLLKKLQESKGDLTLSELSNYLSGTSGKVNQKSILLNSKVQTPEVLVSQKLLEDWREIRLK